MYLSVEYKYTLLNNNMKTLDFLLTILKLLCKKKIDKHHHNLTGSKLA